MNKTFAIDARLGTLRRVAARSLSLAALIAGVVAGEALAQAPSGAAGAAPTIAQQMALDSLKKRPWYANFKAVIDESNSLGRSRIDAGFGDVWSESEALTDAERRIENGLREGRPPTTGAVNDAIDLNASRIMWRAGCFAALAQRSDFRPQATALAALRVDNQTPEPFRSAVKDYASVPCEAPQNLAAKDFDPRRAYEGGKKLLNAAAASGALRPLARFLDERNLLRPDLGVDQSKAARDSVESDFRRFDALYDGHADLLRNYRSLFADYCPTDQRFCLLRDLLAAWGQADKYCDEIVKYIVADYRDSTRRYLTGAENDGLNRAWEAYHIKFAPACIAMTKRLDLAPAVSRRLDDAQSLFANDPKALGDNGVARLREALRGLDADVQNAGQMEARIKAYRAASGLDQQVASVGNLPAATGPAPALPGAPSDEDLKTPGSEASERDLRLDRADVLDIQERLASIGGVVAINGVLNQGARTAIRSWQGAVGLEPTGYFTKAQFDLLKIRTQDRWLQWRANRTAAVEPPQVRPQAEPPRRRQQRVRRAVEPRPSYAEPRGGRRYDGFRSDIPGAIPAYRVWQ